VDETPEPVIRITVNGKPALTTGQAAARHKRTVDVMRVLLHRHGVKAVAHLDGRPLYLASAVDRAVNAMPGKGANLRKATKPPRQRSAATTAPQPTAEPHSYGDLREYRVADSLDDLHGPTAGTITLPHHIDWSGSPDWNLDEPGMLAEMYRTVLAEARSVDDFNTWLDKDRLIELWPGLYLPPQIRRIWSEKFPELTPVYVPAP